MKKLVTVLVMALAMMIAVPTIAEAKTTIKISNTKKTVYTEQSFTLSVKKNGKAVKGTTWKSSKSSIASVSKSGKVSAKKAGKATIKATYKGKEYKCAVTVKDKYKGVALSKKSGSVEAGKSVAIYLQRGKEKLTGMKVKSSNKSIATVSVKNQKITINGKKAGKATITVTWGKKSYKYSVTVKKATKKWAQSAKIKGATRYYETKGKTADLGLSIKANTVKKLNAGESFTFEFEVTNNAWLKEVGATVPYFYTDKVADYNTTTGEVDNYVEPFSFKVKGNQVTVTANKLYRPTGKVAVCLTMDDKEGSGYAYSEQLFYLQNTTKGSDWDTDHVYANDGYTWVCAWTKTVVKEPAKGIHKKLDDFGIYKFTSASGAEWSCYVVNIDIGKGADEVETIYGCWSEVDDALFIANCNKRIKELNGPNDPDLNTNCTQELKDAAIIRAAECTFKAGHTRPNGTQGLVGYELLTYDGYRFGDPAHDGMLRQFNTEDDRVYGAVFLRYEDISALTSDTTGLMMDDENLSVIDNAPFCIGNDLTNQTITGAFLQETVGWKENGCIYCTLGGSVACTEATCAFMFNKQFRLPSAWSDETAEEYWTRLFTQ